MILHRTAGHSQLRRLAKGGVAINYMTGAFCIEGRAGKVQPDDVTFLVGLLSGQRVFHETLYEAQYGDDASGGPDFRIFYVRMYRLRRELEPFGITITTIYTLGWEMADARTKSWLQRQSGNENPKKRSATHPPRTRSVAGVGHS